MIKSKSNGFKRVYFIVIFLLVGLAAPVRADQWPFLSQARAEKEHYSLSESRLFPRTLKYIDKYYVEPERIEPKEMFKGSLNELQKSIPEILVQFNSPTSFTITIDQATKKFSSSLKNLDQFWDLMKEVLAFIELNYKGEADLKDIETIMINSALSTLDPHSAFLTPEIFNEFKIDTGGEFGGLGIVITSKDGQLTVIAPIEDTPAWKAGVKSGDVITQIDDESTINMSLMKAVERLRGKVGSRVVITVERKGRIAPFKLTLTRANIQIDSIKSTLIKDPGESVAYIKVKRFQKETYQDFARDLKKLKAEAGASFKGLVIDFRNNPGGLLDQAVEIADLFLAKGTIVSTVGANKKFIDADEAHEKGTEPSDYPIVVLVNEGSASASEIVAGALQAEGRALVIGQRTFGKGSVQSVYELGSDYALKLTIAQYLTAGKYSIQTVGVTPDITIQPVIIDKEYIDITPNKPSSEKELKKHLDQIKPIAKKDLNIINFYKKYEGDDDIEERRQREYSERLDFTDDFEVKIATRIILASKSSNPETMLKDSTGAIKKLEDQEDEKISAELSSLGTNWAGTPATSSVKLEAASSIRYMDKTVARAEAGKDIGLVVTVSNKGKNPVYKLIGVIESENPLLDEKEFVFGTLAAGASASRSVTIKLPDGLSSQDIPFGVNFKLGKEDISYKFNSDLKIAGLKRPRFSINYELEKPLTVSAKHPLPEGKSVPLTFRVKNVGDGASKEVHAYISNKKNNKDLFIEKGRIDLGVIKPGQVKKATFTFKVLTPSNSSTFLMDLSVADRDLLEFLNTELKITMQSGAIYPPAGVWYEGPEISLSEKNFPVESKGGEFTIIGAITDKKAVKDYYIFVDDEKVVYESNPHETPTMNINATVALKKGNNNVMIVARDLDDLSSVKSFVVQR